MTNFLKVIHPYRAGGMWVFDDSAAGLVQEPFVSGIPEMIDILVKDIPDADRGFRLLFAPGPFPGFLVQLDLVRPEFGGNWYRWGERNMEGWLCPALFKYFDKAPSQLFVRVEKKP